MGNKGIVPKAIILRSVGWAVREKSSTRATAPARPKGGRLALDVRMGSSQARRFNCHSRSGKPIGGLPLLDVCSSRKILLDGIWNNYDYLMHAPCHAVLSNAKVLERRR